MSSIVRFKKREIIYREGDPADTIFNVNTGSAYLQKLKYTKRARAITVIAYRLPVATLRSRLPKEAELEFHVIRKLCQGLRQGIVLTCAAAGAAR